MWVHVTYLLTHSVIKSSDSSDWLIQTFYQSASSCVTEATFLTKIVSEYDQEIPQSQTADNP